MDNRDLVMSLGGLSTPLVAHGCNSLAHSLRDARAEIPSQALSGSPAKLWLKPSSVSVGVAEGTPGSVGIRSMRPKLGSSIDRTELPHW